MRGQRFHDNIEDIMTAMRLGCCADVIQDYGDRRQGHDWGSAEKATMFLLVKYRMVGRSVDYSTGSTLQGKK